MEQVRHVEIRRAESLLKLLRKDVFEGFQRISLFPDRMSASLIPVHSDLEAAQADLEQGQRDAEKVAQEMWHTLESARHG